MLSEPSLLPSNDQQRCRTTALRSNQGTPRYNLMTLPKLSVTDAGAPYRKPECEHPSAATWLHKDFETAMAVVRPGSRVLYKGMQEGCEEKGILDVVRRILGCERQAENVQVSSIHNPGR